MSSSQEKSIYVRQVYMVILSLYGLHTVCNFDGFLDDWTILRRFYFMARGELGRPFYYYFPPLPIFLTPTLILVYSLPFLFTFIAPYSSTHFAFILANAFYFFSLHLYQLVRVNTRNLSCKLERDLGGGRMMDGTGQTFC
jgi:hypothetical protein